MPKHILCADDSVTMQKVVAITFAHTDYQVTSARSADEAVALARQSRPDLVLADAVMPGKTGYDLCQALKNDPALRGVPVVILCGNSAAFDEARGRAVGADASLTKPWDTQVFVEKIGEILGRVASQGVAHAQAAGPTRPAAPPAPAAVAPPAAAGHRPTMTHGIPAQRPPGSPIGGPPPAAAPRPAIVQPRPVPGGGVVTPPVGLPRPPAGLPRPPLIRGAPVSGRPVGASAPAPVAAPVQRPATNPPAAAVARPAAVAPPVAAPATPARRQATMMGMPAVNMPPAATAHAPPPVFAQPAPVAPPQVHAPPPPVNVAPVAPSRAYTPPPAAAIPTPAPPAPTRPLPGSDALARAAQRVAAATTTAAGLDTRGPEYEAIAKISREIIEQIAWEVVPELAELIIRERLNELKK